MDAVLPELDRLDALIASLGDRARVATACEVDVAGRGRLPVRVVTLGSSAPDAPTVGFFSGVHGLERIGTAVVLSYLETLAELARWDAAIHDLLGRVRLVFVPIVNPGGMLLGWRSNPRGVDLMRNAPVESYESAFLVGGHRYTPKLPWYRGRAGDPMEAEAQALVATVRTALFPSPVAIALDVHSGFGMRDHLWFPYARTRAPFPGLAPAFALKRLLDRTYPNHFYAYEPQSLSYTTHGDLWDHLYDLHRAEAAPGRTFLPLTLEMGSWRWLKKNPRQLFSALGVFHPVKPHRLQRTLRRHILLFDFLARAAASPRGWIDSADAATREAAERQWYGAQRTT